MGRDGKLSEGFKQRGGGDLIHAFKRSLWLPCGKWAVVEGRSYSSERLAFTSAQLCLLQSV